MSKIVESLYAKRIGTSFYHFNTLYHKRYEIGDTKDDAWDFMAKEIANIQSEVMITAEANVIINSIKSSVNDRNTEEINRKVMLLNMLGYEMYFIIRNDLSSNIELENLNRVYMLNKLILADPALTENIPNINIFQIGKATAFDDAISANINSMTMNFIERDALYIGDIEENGLVGLPSLISQYKTLDESNETALMDTQNLLRALELRGYRFFISMEKLAEANI